MIAASSSSGAVVETAPAKLNLYLHVVGRRPDGYHLLDSLVAFTEFGDELSVAPGADLTLAIEGPFADALRDESDNLVLKAARALQQRAGVTPHPDPPPQGGREQASSPSPLEGEGRGGGWATTTPRGARITLTKNLPVASGIGGGSADAAATLRALSKLWNVTAPLDDIAAGLGADVPMCLASRPALVGGIGDILGPAPPLPPLGVVLVNPRTLLPTPAVFAARSGTFSVARPLATDGGLIAALAERRNDLEPAAAGLVPEVAEMLAALRNDGAVLARMSGSGATCFGLYDDGRAAVAAAARLQRRQPGWWVAPTALRAK